MDSISEVAVYDVSHTPLPVLLPPVLPSQIRRPSLPDTLLPLYFSPRQ